MAICTASSSLPRHACSTFARKTVAIALLLCSTVATYMSTGFAGQDAFLGDPASITWRLRFFEAAVVQGDTVLLEEIAIPVGNMPPEVWEKIRTRPLWASPPEGRGAVNMTRPKLQEAVVRTMRDLSPYCLFPGSVAIQRGGAVLNREAVQQVVVNNLTSYLHALPGESSFTDFRLPPYIFLKHAGQQVVVEAPKKVTAGRLSLRLLVQELDGSISQKLSGSVFIDSWVQAPCAAVPLNRDEVLEPGKITFIRTNLAHVRGEPWDGRGGPWRVLRPVGLQQILYQSDLGTIPTIRKGSVVTLVYEGKSITLTTKAEALSDGVIGENIPVRNLQSKKEIYAIVKDAATVVIGTTQ